MGDIRKTKYAEFIERLCEIVMAYSPESIAVAYRTGDGGVGCFYMDCSMCDKMTMASMIQYDATMDGLRANPEQLREILEEGDKDEY
jgi:hypothetical protein